MASTRSSRAARWWTAPGLPMRTADVGIRDGHHHRHRPSLGRASSVHRRRRARRDARHRRRAHALRPAAHLRAVRHLVVLPRRHLGGRRQLRLLDRAVRPAGPRLAHGAVRQGRGHDAERARARGCRGTGTASRPSWRCSTSGSASTLADLRRTLRAAALRHGRSRVGARRHGRRGRGHAGRWCARRCAPARRGSPRRTRPTHVDQFESSGAVAPRATSTRSWRSPRRRARVAPARIAFLAAQRGAGRTTRAIARALIEAGARAPGCRSSCRAWATAPASARCGTTRRPSSPTRARQGAADLLDAAHAAVHAAVQLAARHVAVRRRVPLARPPGAAARGAAGADERSGQSREKLRWALDNPNKDPSKGSTLPPARHDRAVRRPLRERSGRRGQEPGAAREGARRPSRRRDVRAGGRRRPRNAVPVEQRESAPWIEANAESQRNLHMIIGTGDGGAHADRDDGAEWSTYFLRSWLLDREHMHARGGRPPHHAPSRHDLRHPAARPARARLPRRRDDVRSRPHPARQEAAGRATCRAARSAGRCGPRASSACW